MGPNKNTKGVIKEFLEKYQGLKTEPNSVRLKGCGRPDATFSLRKHPVWELVNMLQDGWFDGVKWFK